VTTGVPFSVAISGLAPVSTYYFSAQACNSAGEGEWGGELSFVTLGYTLIVSSSTGGHVSVPGEGPFSYARGRSVQVTATSDLNYHFVNWTGTAVDAGKVANPSSASTTVTMDADYTLQANFAIDRYWVIISATPGGSVSLPGQGSFSYDYGTWVNLLASPDAGYRFVNWTGTGAPRVVPRLPNGDKILVDADYTLVANFSETAPICGDGRCDPGEDRSSCPGDCPDKPPVASFTYLPDKPLAGEKVRLDASNSKDPDGRIMSYLWDYGDGTGEGTTSPVVEHTFKTPGEYKVTLMVTDNDGQTGTVTSTITVITVTRGQFMIAFDDGPVPENTEKILDALKNIKVDGEPVRAGFFMVGVGCCEDAICYCLSPNQLPSMGSVRSNPDLVRMVAQAGHIIGVHTQHHPWFGEWSLDDIKREISTCLEEIRKAAPGANITTFRAPYLCAVPNVVAAAKALDLQIIPGVGENEDLSVDEGGRQWTKARSLIESWDKGYPCVLTFHDASPDTPGNIADIVAYLEKEGFALVHFDPDRIPDEVQTIHTLSGIAHCPVDLVVTDPAGLVLSKEQKEIPDAIYEELDVDGDGDLEDSFLVPDARLGQYLVYVIPDPNAPPNETYSLEVSVDGQSSVSARDVLVKDAPRDPYRVPVPPPAPLPTPVAHWTFDEGTGWIAHDSVGTNDAWIGGLANQWTQGVLGGALSFDGVTNHTDSKSTAVLNPEELTITFWSMTDRIGAEQYVVARERGQQFETDYIVSYSADGRMKFRFGESYEHNVKVVTEPIKQLNTWVHVAAVRDGSKAILYLDGKLAASAPYSYVPVNHGHLLRFGGGYNSSPLKGKIDDIRIYDGALSTEQIQTLYGQR
jgi:peptidoglycan/xylan/chitin deacetylase (PgdA/CDA1 family)